MSHDLSGFSVSKRDPVCVSQANSYTVSSVVAPSWLHRFIIGKKGQNLAKITQQMPKVCVCVCGWRVFVPEGDAAHGLTWCFLCVLQVHIEFTEGEDKITLEGPTKDMQMVQSQMEAIVTDLVKTV